MAAERSEASPYESRFDGGWLAPAQFLAEGMVARQARAKKTVLPMKFWNDDRYKRAFMVQLRLATSLLKIYDFEAIIRVLRSKAAKNVFSFGAKIPENSLRLWARTRFREATCRDGLQIGTHGQGAFSKTRLLHR